MTGSAALTGATGFIGRVIAQRLAAAGWRVKGLRRGSARSGDDRSITWIEGSLEDPQALQRLVQDADALVHCAGVVRGASREDFYRVNVEGTARLARIAASQPRPPRFVLLSSLAAREPDLSFYAASKREGERALEEAAGDMPWAALRPSAVYGPGDRELLPLLRWMARGIAPLLGSEQAHVSLVYVDDLADAVLGALATAVPGGAVYEVGDGQPGGYTWNEVAEAAARLRAARLLRLRVPPALPTLAARLNLLRARLGGRPPMLTPGKLRELYHPDWVCDNGPLTAATGWTPRVTLAEGLRRTLGPLPTNA